MLLPAFTFRGLWRSSCLCRCPTCACSMTSRRAAMPLFAPFPLTRCLSCFLFAMFGRSQAALHSDRCACLLRNNQGLSTATLSCANLAYHALTGTRCHACLLPQIRGHMYSNNTKLALCKPAVEFSRASSPKELAHVMSLHVCQGLVCASHTLLSTPYAIYLSAFQTNEWWCSHNQLLETCTALRRILEFVYNP